MSEASYRAPKGTQDILWPESARWERLVATFASLAERSGYGLHVPPMFEHYEVFARVGASTDIVRKEMYDFDDRGGRHLALRPEGTASVVRAFVEHRPTTPFKAWYVGPSFRNERPQKGRYRQHHQVGAEVLGSDDPTVDVEVIALLSDLYAALGLTQVRLHLNSLGDATCRPAYLDALRGHLEANLSALSAQSADTLGTNPLRVLDSKRPEDQPIIEGAPKQIDHLCGACAVHFASVRDGLAALGVGYEVAPRLVRGLDYYTRTTFEFAADALDGAQNAVGGGGRYDGLAEQMGGPPTPGIGFGAGIERMLLACDAEGTFPAPTATVDVFIVDVSGAASGLVLARELRGVGLRVDRGVDGRSMKSQLKQADRLGASLALIIGEQELADGTVVVRDLAAGEQQAVPRDGIVEHVRKALQS